MLEKNIIELIITELVNSADECVTPIGFCVTSGVTIHLAYYDDLCNIKIKLINFDGNLNISKHLKVKHMGVPFVLDNFKKPKNVNIHSLKARTIVNAYNKKTIKADYIDDDNEFILFHRKIIGFFLEPISQTTFEFDYTQDNFDLLSDI